MKPAAIYLAALALGATAVFSAQPGAAATDGSCIEKCRSRCTGGSTLEKQDCLTKCQVTCNIAGAAPAAPTQQITPGPAGPNTPKAPARQSPGKAR